MAGSPSEPLSDMAILERRRIEAILLKHVYETLQASHGKDAAQRTIGDAVQRQRPAAQSVFLPLAPRDR